MPTRDAFVVPSVSPLPIRLGLVGIGKIARDQHLPAIAADRRFELVATASRNAGIDGTPAYPEIDAMIAGGHRLDAVSVCTPPAGRAAIVSAAIDAGWHVMLEKPPAATLGEIIALHKKAEAAEVTLFATWHSREAAGVAPARDWLAERRVMAVRIAWKEDIRRWHPGQEWIMEAGGFGVFDPGINALSIATSILPEPLVVETAEFDIPEGRASPIAARLRMRTGAAPVDVDLDFLQTGPQSWKIVVETDDGVIDLRDGGRSLSINGGNAADSPDREYPELYARFAELVVARSCDVDLAPLQTVADCFLVAKTNIVAPFVF